MCVFLAWNEFGEYTRFWIGNDPASGAMWYWYLRESNPETGDRFPFSRIVLT